MKRRKFIHTGMTAASSAMLRVPADGEEQTGPAQVYEAYDARICTHEKPDRSHVDGGRVQHAVNALITAMTGENVPGKAWESLFPGITPDATIAIKMNLLRQYNGPQFATLSAVVKGLTSMFDGAYPPSNIALFDRYSDDADKQYGAGELDRLGVWHGHVDFHGDEIPVVGRKLNIATVFSKADYGINMVASRRHHCFAGYLSGVIKNMMGALSIARDRYETLQAYSGGEFHDNSNYTAFVDMFQEYFINTLHLYVVDHILIPKDEGKTYFSAIGNRIACGTDPCAMDAYTVDLLNRTFSFERGEEPTKNVPAALAENGLGRLEYHVRRVL